MRAMDFLRHDTDVQRSALQNAERRCANTVGKILWTSESCLTKSRGERLIVTILPMRLHRFTLILAGVSKINAELLGSPASG